jgi:hypothetical protein
MKKLLGWLALLALAGCASAPADRGGQNSGVGAAQTTSTPRYEHQLEVFYTDVATPFLRLVEVRAP